MGRAEDQGQMIVIGVNCFRLQRLCWADKGGIPAGCQGAIPPGKASRRLAKLIEPGVAGMVEGCIRQFIQGIAELDLRQNTGRLVGNSIVQGQEDRDPQCGDGGCFGPDDINDMSVGGKEEPIDDRCGADFATDRLQGERFQKCRQPGAQLLPNGRGKQILLLRQNQLRRCVGKKLLGITERAAAKLFLFQLEPIKGMRAETESIGFLANCREECTAHDFARD